MDHGGIRLPATLSFSLRVSLGEKKNSNMQNYTFLNLKLYPKISSKYFFPPSCFNI